jgi:hypothetical protein
MPIQSRPAASEPQTLSTPAQAVRHRIYASAGRNIILDGTERSFSFEELPAAPLIIDAIYRGGQRGDLRDDPIARLFRGAGNQGGFRPIGRPKQGRCRALVISSSGTDPD